MTEHEFTLAAVICPLLVVFAEQDNLLDGEKGALPRKTEVCEVRESNHFFLGKEEELSAIVEGFLMQL